MESPVLHLIAGPNGAGKTTFYEQVLRPATRLPFINADQIALERWPNDPSAHAYDAAELAASWRDAEIAARRSFLAETVFSHPSKLQLVHRARSAGYLVHLHVILIPEDLAVARVADRVEVGGHTVPEGKIRERYRRLWPLVRQAMQVVHEATVRDNSRASTPFRVVARFRAGKLLEPGGWPPWTPPDLLVLPPGQDPRKRRAASPSGAAQAPPPVRGLVERSSVGRQRDCMAAVPPVIGRTDLIEPTPRLSV